MDENGKPLNIVYYYEGKPEVTNETIDAASGLLTSNKLQREAFIGNEGNIQRGIRKILHDRNTKVLEKIEVLKKDWRDKKFSSNKDLNDSIYQARAKEIRNDSTLTRPVVVIKATPQASWESLISALDEMQINQISRYQIDNMNNIDSLMVIDYVARHGKKK